MKHLLLTCISIMMLGAITAQETCDKASIELLIQEKMAENQQKEQANQQNYETEVAKLAKAMNWSEDQKLSYLMELVSAESFQQSTNKKYSMVLETINMFKEVDTLNATAANCAVKTKISDKLDLVIANNDAEWAKVMNQVAKDYKATGKTTGDAAAQKASTSGSSNSLRPETIVGIWIDQDKEENYVFNADGTVYDQSYKTGFKYNMRYWYVKNGKIYFSFSEKPEGGMGIPYELEGDMLTITAFGEKMIYKKK